MIFKLSRLFSSCLYTGFLPFMPGTWGSLFALFCISFFGLSWKSFIVVLILALLSCQIITYYTKTTDPSWIVIDEFLGLHLTLLLYKHHFGNFSYINLLELFLLFRLFDIWKPFPISYIDNLLLQDKATEGLGIILDDLIAGILAFGAYYSLIFIVN